MGISIPTKANVCVSCWVYKFVQKEPDNCLSHAEEIPPSCCMAGTWRQPRNNIFLLFKHQFYQSLHVKKHHFSISVNFSNRPALSWLPLVKQGRWQSPILVAGFFTNSSGFSTAMFDYIGSCLPLSVVGHCMSWSSKYSRMGSIVEDRLGKGLFSMLKISGVFPAFTGHHQVYPSNHCLFHIPVWIHFDS